MKNEELKREMLDLVEFIRVCNGMNTYKKVTPIFYYWMYHNLKCLSFEEYEKLSKDFV